MAKKPRVAFLCSHNSCRSQVAEALAKEIASDTFEAYSAGIEPSYTVDDRTAWMLLEYCSYDITERYPKHVSELPDVDIVISMGYGNDFSNVPCTYTENWELESPKDQEDNAYRRMIEDVRSKVCDLRDKIRLNGIHQTA